MEATARFEKPGRTRLLIGTGILLATQLASVWVGKRPPEEGGVAGAASLIALGTLAIGALGLRQTSYPRWAYATMVGVLAAAIAISPLTATSAEAWVEQTRDSLWLVPWFVLMLSVLPPSRRGACAPDHPRVGWFLVGGALLMGGMLQLYTRLPF